MPPTLKTLFDKVWDDHVVVQEPGNPAVLYVDLHLVNEVTSPQAFASLRARGMRVRRPSKTVATMDHSISTLPPALSILDRSATAQLEQLKLNCHEYGIRLYPQGSKNHGILHIIGPELGLTQPGKTIVCGDSHTSTHGAFGALAFGIGTSEVEHVLATQCLLQHRPKTLNVRLGGRCGPCVTSKDIILAIIAEIGVEGGVGHVIEYTGEAIHRMGMDGRMTVCNMSIEAGARSAVVAPDETTFEYLARRDYSPKGDAWEVALANWRKLSTDIGARYDLTLTFDVSQLEPMVTYGTNPGMAVPITSPIPDPDCLSDPVQKASLKKSLHYMDLRPGRSLLGQKVNVVFIGSCTNSRITDLREAARVMRGQKVADGVRVLVVPGSQHTKTQAEAEKLDVVFEQAGAEWRDPGCSMCVAMNDDKLGSGQYALSTSNRNFEGRQGKNSRTFLASPLTAAATAIRGKIADPREFSN